MEEMQTANAKSTEAMSSAKTEISAAKKELQGLGLELQGLVTQVSFLVNVHSQSAILTVLKQSSTFVSFYIFFIKDYMKCIIHSESLVEALWHIIHNDHVNYLKSDIHLTHSV